MERELVPELHDIFKICERTLLGDARKPLSPHGSPYRVEKYIEEHYPDLLIDETLQGILRHHECTSFKLFPNSLTTFAVDTADNLASAMSRFKHRFGNWDHQLYKLWRNNPQEAKPHRTVAPLSFEWVLDFLAAGKNFEDLEKYCDGTFPRHDENPLFRRAEDSVIGANLTSLYTHLTLSGKFYRMLLEAGYTIADDQIPASNRQALGHLRRQKCAEWTMTVCHAKLHFPQKPVRTRDMNVFEELQNVLGKVEQQFAD
jgi:hypothetical protein